MNSAIGHGSSGGRCWRSRGKWRINTRTSSLLHSQKLASSSRSSSGVNRSEEKIVVGASDTVSPCAGWRLRRRGFMAVRSLLLEEVHTRYATASLPPPCVEGKAGPLRREGVEE